MRPNNYQMVVESLEAIARAYAGRVEIFIYFSGASHVEMSGYLERLRFDNRSMFVFECGPNRIDEPKYRLPLRSNCNFILTTDDDCLFAPDTLSLLMDTYHTISARYGFPLAPVGWFGTDLNDGQLLTPIEGRFPLKRGEWRQVDYLGSCCCLYRREILATSDFTLEKWPPQFRHASDLWLSFLLTARYKTPMFVTSLVKEDLPEHGVSLWEQHNREYFNAYVSELVALGWKQAARLSRQIGKKEED
jgi:hypothetical protein